MDPRRAPLMGILALALGLRIAAAIGMQVYLDRYDRQFLIAGDASGYWELGRRIAAGEDYALYDPPRRILRMPGFPALLALSGGSLTAARLILAVVGTIACGLVYLLGRELVDERTGLIAAAVVSLSPPLVAFSALILSETTFAAATLFSLWLMARLWNSQDSPSRPATLLLAFCVGASVSLACYVRPSWLLFGPAFALALLFKSPDRKRGLLQGALLLAGMAVALLPWVVRNERVTGGRIVVTTLWAGPSLYDGLNPDATGASDMSFFERDALMSSMSEYEMDREYRRRAWEFARDNPGRAVELAGRKLARFWKPWPNAAQFRRWWIAAICCAVFLIVVLPAVYGFWLRRRDFGLLLLTAGPILYFSAIHAVFVGSVRYRLPAEYALCVLTAVGLGALPGLRRSDAPAAINS